MVTTKQRAKTKGTRKPATGVAIPKGIVEKATLTLQELPEKPKESLSLKETIESMYDAIKAALAKGYSQEDVASFLSDKGVDITPASLKYYLSRLGRGRSAEAAKPRKVRRTTSQTVDAAQADASTPEESTAAPKRRGSRSSTQADAAPNGRTSKRTAAKSKSTAAESSVATNSSETEAPAPQKRSLRSTPQTRTKAPAKSKAADTAVPKPSTRQRKKA